MAKQIVEATAEAGVSVGHGGVWPVESGHEGAVQHIWRVKKTFGKGKVSLVKGASVDSVGYKDFLAALVRRVSMSIVITGVSEASEGLDSIASDAVDMGYEIPEESVVSEASRILGEMRSYRALSFDAYSMSGGRVGIDVNGGVGRSMIVVCEPGGSALCVVTVGGDARRARYENSRFLVDDFVRQGLRDMNVNSASGLTP